MAVGQDFILSVIRDNAPARLMVYDESFFTENEHELYNYVRDHFSRHGSLPTKNTLVEAGFRLREPRIPKDDSLSVYEENLQKRNTYAAAIDAMQVIQPILSSGAVKDLDHEVIQTAFATALTRINQSFFTSNARSYNNAVDRMIENAERARRSIGRMQGVTLGWDHLDELVRGAKGGEIVVVVARPNVGKTWIMTKMINGARCAGKKILFHSMEMSREQLTLRMAGIDTRINPQFIESGELSPWGWDTIYGYQEQHADNVRDYVSDSGVPTVEGLSAVVDQFNPEVVYVDAAYLMTATAKRYGNLSKWERLSDVIASLKAMATRRNIPVFITVQFNRNQKDKSTMHAADKRDLVILKNRGGEVGALRINFKHSPVDFSPVEDQPDLSEMRVMDLCDIGGSDSISQDASIIIAVTRAGEMQRGNEGNQETQRDDWQEQ